MKKEYVRIIKFIDIPLPNDKGREEMFKINLKGTDIDENVDFNYLVKNTEGYSGSDIANVCREETRRRESSKKNKRARIEN